MNLSRSLLFLLPCTMLLAQSSDPLEKAPPESDEALRARVTIFYNATVSGKYHEALKVVAEDALDDYMGDSKGQFKSCEINKINYSDSFTKALVVTFCKGEYRWHGSHMPVTIPATSTWKMVDGQWFWYYIHQTEVQTPWGIMGGDSSGSAQMPSIPPDPAALARQILSKVSIDRNRVDLSQSTLSQDEVHVANQMPGPVTVSVDPLPLAGMSVKIDPAQVPAGGKATITFAYNPNDPSIACSECIAHAQLPPLTANVRVSPTAGVFPVKITFARDVRTGQPFELPKQ